MARPDYFILAAFGDGVRGDAAVLDYYAREVVYARGAAYLAAAPRAPGALRRQVLGRRIEATRQELREPENSARAIGALSDWAAVLRIADHRQRSLSAG